MSTKELPVATFDELRWLADAYEQVQRLRIAAGNRLHAVKHQADQGPPFPATQVIHERSEELEEAIAQWITQTVEGHPAWPWLAQLRGMGPLIAGRLLGLIWHVGPRAFCSASRAEPEEQLDEGEEGEEVTTEEPRVRKPKCQWRTALRNPADAPPACPRCGKPVIVDADSMSTVSKLWRFAGYAVLDGQIQRPVKGQRRDYNRRLKVAAYLAGAQFLRSGSKFREIYDRARARYTHTRQDRVLQALVPEAYEAFMHWVAAHPVAHLDAETRKEHQRQLLAKRKQLVAKARKVAAQRKWKQEDWPWTVAHVHQAALRKMIKVFLACLWEVWREATGFPIRAPYVQEYLGHQLHWRPEDFVEPEPRKRARKAG